jgi:hypothetical protein
MMMPALHNKDLNMVLQYLETKLFLALDDYRHCAVLVL